MFSGSFDYRTNTRAKVAVAVKRMATYIALRFPAPGDPAEQPLMATIRAMVEMYDLDRLMPGEEDSVADLFRASLEKQRAQPDQKKEQNPHMIAQGVYQYLLDLSQRYRREGTAQLAEVTPCRRALLDMMTLWPAKVTNDTWEMLRDLVSGEIIQALDPDCREVFRRHMTVSGPAQIELLCQTADCMDGYTFLQTREMRQLLSQSESTGPEVLLEAARAVAWDAPQQEGPAMSLPGG